MHVYIVYDGAQTIGVYADGFDANYIVDQAKRVLGKHLSLVVWDVMESSRKIEESDQ